MEIDQQTVEQHYTSRSLFRSIVGALQQAGKDLAQVSPDDLAPVDEFHTRGRPATVEPARLAGLAAGQQVLVWSQNMAMNISDRPRRYAEIRRVLRPDGRYALSDIVCGEGGDPYYPMP